jgi:penicillin-binding protein 1A
MAYAHSNIEIKPVSGIDFKPAPFVQTAQSPGSQPPRPPALAPEAAEKLLEIADDLKAAGAPPPAASTTREASIAHPGTRGL